MILSKALNKISVKSCINGLGNLLLVTRQENSALGNEYPARKDCPKVCQAERGEKIFDFILRTMLE